MHRVPDFTFRDFRNPQQSFVPQEVGLNPGNSPTENFWPAIHNNLTRHHYFPVSDVPSAPLSSYWWRATVTWEELQNHQQGPTAHSPETCYHWRHSSPAVQGTSKISTGFSLSDHRLIANWNHLHRQRRIRASQPESTLNARKRGTAPLQRWQPRLRISYICFSYRAQQELCSKGCAKASMRRAWTAAILEPANHRQ